MKLSIVIPYYKTYELTDKLLKSILLQDSKEIEVILIDDGCNEIRFDEYMAKFNNFKVIHQENKGCAYNRNKGTELAKGEYIAFIDSDDMITLDYVETLLNAIKTYNTDIINFNWVDLGENILYTRPNNPAVWKAIYKKEKMFDFLEGIPYGGEDYYFQKELEKRINEGYTITYLDRVLYLYYSNRVDSYTWQSKHREEQ